MYKRQVLQQVFDLVDRFDLYGQVAYPKQHSRAQIPALYRWAARRGGLFVNPALTEPFGLTLLEAAACGLPMVATDDGGPRDIQHRCDNGLLADVTDPGALQEALELAGSDRSRWRRWSDNGVEAISRHFSWDAHVCQYLALMQQKVRVSPVRGMSVVRRPSPVSRLLALDLDSCLELPEERSLAHLRDRLQAEPFAASTGLVILTGRSLDQARQRYQELHLPEPKAWICRAGTEIHHSSDRVEDPVWAKRISQAWDREAVLSAMGQLQEHLQLQDPDHQSPFKVSYLLRASNRGLIGLARQCLRRHGLQAELSSVAIGSWMFFPSARPAVRPSVFWLSLGSSPCSRFWWWPVSRGTESCWMVCPQRWFLRITIPACWANGPSSGCTSRNAPVLEPCWMA